MMKKVILIAGLPGSGKSVLGNKLIEELEDSIFFDSVSDDAEMNIIEKACGEYEIVIMASPFLCVDTARDRAKRFFKRINKKAKIEWRFFDYDVKSCISNKPSMKNKILEVAQFYSIPPRNKKLKVESYEETDKERTDNS